MAAPSGGLAAIGSSLGRGVPAKGDGRRRTAGAGAKSQADARATSSSICRSGVTSSRIQKARPWVAITRSLPCTSMSRTEVTGKSSWSDCQ